MPYADPAGAFTVSVPEGWAQSPDGDAVSFTDKLNTVRVRVLDVAVGADDRLRHRRRPSGDRLLHTRATRRATSRRSRRKAGDAVLATYQGDSAADPVTGKVVHDAFERYTFWHDGTTVVLTLSGPVGADNVDPWKIVSDSLAWSK